MTVAGVNYLNIALMFVSVVLAYVFPFELFLFSYAILGPLHYLTEIGWLHKRHYFTTGQRDYILLIGICLLMLILFLIDTGFEHHFIGYAWLTNWGIKQNMVSPWLRTWISALIIMAFVAALAMVLFKDKRDKLIFTLISTGILLLISVLRPYLIILALLLPTLIHTTLFMGAFILFGSIKGHSFSGYLSVAIFVLCCFVFFIYTPDINYQASPFFVEHFLQSGFTNLSRLFLGNDDLNKALFSPFGLKVQRFIAFAYTYHYLNWFSKTKVIDWHNVSPAWRWFTVIIWALSIGLYVIDFRIGLAAVFFLSMLHVFLEFPLNYRTFQGIGKGITGMFRKA